MYANYKLLIKTNIIMWSFTQTSHTYTLRIILLFCFKKTGTEKLARWKPYLLVFLLVYSILQLWNHYATIDPRQRTNCQGGSRKEQRKRSQAGHQLDQWQGSWEKDMELKKYLGKKSISIRSAMNKLWQMDTHMHTLAPRLCKHHSHCCVFEPNLVCCYPVGTHNHMSPICRIRFKSCFWNVRME